MPEIILKNITKKWGKFVGVKDMNMVIENRDFITLLGPSGCGKTTTLRMIAGLETPTSGQIIIDNKVVFDSEKGINIGANKRNVGFIFQNYALWPHMTVRQNISFGLENLKWDKEKIEERVNELLVMLKIDKFDKRYPSEISGGQQQRVAIARTLAPKPQVLFMDEPLSNLDAKLRQEMRTELKRLHADTNSTFVYVTHDQLEAMALATKVCLLDEGVVQQFDPPLVIYGKPKNMFVADFVGNPTMNFINCTGKKTSKRNQIDLDLLGFKFKFKSKNNIDLKSKDLVLGIRPEYLPICDNGIIHATAYSTLPSGMETTVKVQYKEQLLTSVVFGSIDYAVDQKVDVNIIGENLVLFEKETGNKIALGSVEIIE